MIRPIIIIGAGGHATVLLDILLKQAGTIMGITESDAEKNGSSIMGIPVIGDDEAVLSFSNDSIYLVNALGFVKSESRRSKLFNYFKSLGYEFARVVSDQAFRASEVVLGEGCQLMPGTIIQTGCQIGDNCLINTGAIVDHQCIIGDHVHIAPGAVLSGNVIVGENTLIGVGSRIIQGVTIGSNCIIGAGSVIINDIPDWSTVVGVPAKVVKSIE